LIHSCWQHARRCEHRRAESAPPSASASARQTDAGMHAGREPASQCRRHCAFYCSSSVVASKSPPTAARIVPPFVSTTETRPVLPSRAGPGCCRCLVVKSMPERASACSLSHARTHGSRRCHPARVRASQACSPHAHMQARLKSMRWCSVSSRFQRSAAAASDCGGGGCNWKRTASALVTSP